MKGMSHVETLYALKRQGRGPVESEIVYRLGRSIQDVWTAVASERGIDAQALRVAGWRAIKVIVQEV